MKEVNVNIRFIGDEGVINFSIECLRVQLEENIISRRFENKEDFKHIEAEITSIK